MNKLFQDILIFIGGIFIFIIVLFGIKIAISFFISEKNLPANYQTSNNPDKTPDYPSPNQFDSYPDW